MSNLYTTRNYIVRAAQGAGTPDQGFSPNYEIVNSTTNLVEGGAAELPSAISQCIQLDYWMTGDNIKDAVSASLARGGEFAVAHPH